MDKPKEGFTITRDEKTKEIVYIEPPKELVDKIAETLKNGVEFMQMPLKIGQCGTTYELGNGEALAKYILIELYFYFRGTKLLE